MSHQTKELIKKLHYITNIKNVFELGKFVQEENIDNDLDKETQELEKNIDSLMFNKDSMEKSEYVKTLNDYNQKLAHLKGQIHKNKIAKNNLSDHNYDLKLHNLEINLKKLCDDLKIHVQKQDMSISDLYMVLNELEVILNSEQHSNNGILKQFHVIIDAYKSIVEGLKNELIYGKRITSEEVLRLAKTLYSNKLNEQTYIKGKCLGGSIKFDKAAIEENRELIEELIGATNLKSPISSLTDLTKTNCDKTWNGLNTETEIKAINTLLAMASACGIVDLNVEFVDYSNYDALINSVRKNQDQLISENLHIIKDDLTFIVNKNKQKVIETKKAQ